MGHSLKLFRATQKHDVRLEYDLSCTRRAYAIHTNFGRRLGRRGGGFQLDAENLVHSEMEM